MFQFSSKIRYSEVDADCNLTIPSLVNYFQDCTCFHSESVGDGVEVLRSRHQAWILSFYQICISRMPKHLEEVTIATYPYEIKGFYGMRNFCLLDQAGNQLACANSIWVLIDTTTGRPVRASQEQIDAYGADEKITMNYCERKLTMPETLDKQEPVTVPTHFIDSNHHMNNGKYVVLAMEYVPKDFVIEELRIEYKKEAKLKDIITPAVCVEEGRITVALFDEGDKPYAIIIFIGKN